MEQLKKRAEELLLAVKSDAQKLGVDKLQDERDAIRKRMQEPGFWQDSKEAQELSKKEASLTKRLAPWKEIKTEADSLVYLISQGEDNLEVELEKVEENYQELKKELRFNGPHDGYDVIMNIYAGAGGTDAQDWAQMLLRMYVRWAEQHGLKVETFEQSAGEEAGIKSATIKIGGGSFLYGKLSGENGVHRLVRKSPFNSAGSRETSFARVEILPAIDAPDEIKLDEKDLRIDVFRAGGHGGQSVNTTDSAVRITHVPTGITVVIQNERSQLQNKETALTVLRSRLARLQLDQHAEKLEDLKGPDKSNEWGSQIRNYILDDRIVKDLRTGYESHDPQKILDGDLDPLIDAWLEHAS